MDLKCSPQYAILFYREKYEKPFLRWIRWGVSHPLMLQVRVNMIQWQIEGIKNLQQQ